MTASIFTTHFDDLAPPAEQHVAVQVYPDGSRVELERFGNKEDAEYFAQAMGLLTEKNRVQR